ncbi:ABC transporter permease [Fundicoccus ignavus]|uniref:ABC transporter permease subunit n=1 Tax=Fundicoccus ignavus TaxID=2664442 RepID=A0A844BV45_9LACT|nr:ABC transporter permease [Fundicoccus ignavus]MRJ45984.1 ABC transporter permease subunit [Fundicoccus ignavus]
MTEQQVNAHKQTYNFLPDDFEWADKSQDAHEQEIYVRESAFKQFLVKFSKNKGSVFGLVFIITIVFFALLGPYMNDFGSNEQIIGNESMAPRVPFLENFGILDGGQTLKASTGSMVINKYETNPNAADTYYWFGSDVLGRDIFTRTWEGTRISLYIALVAVIVDVLIGMTYGLISGYFGGKVDMIMQRLLEILNGIPSLVIVTLLIVVLRPGILSITIAIALTGWIGMSRVARAQILKLKDREFVLAARTLGAKPSTLIFKEILPNIFAQLIIMSMFSVPNAIFTESFLAFIGLGVPMPNASLGSLISDAFKSFLNAPFMIIPPVLVLSLTMLSFNLLADGLRDALDPTMKEV